MRKSLPSAWFIFLLTCLPFAGSDYLHGQELSEPGVIMRANGDITQMLSTNFVGKQVGTFLNGSSQFGPLSSPNESQTEEKISVVKPFLLSVLLPGMGQLSRQQKRGYIYLVAEAATITAAALFHKQGKDREDEYRGFVLETARQGNPGFADPLRSSSNKDGDFDYYEDMTKFDSSGLFDTDPRSDVFSPEMDLLTFNGEQWRIATIKFPDDPNSQLEFYMRNAVTSDFYWNWDNREDELKEYKGKFEAADDSFQNRTLSLQGLLANHVASAIDAFISAKVHNSRFMRRANLKLNLKGTKLVLTKIF